MGNEGWMVVEGELKEAKNLGKENTNVTLKTVQLLGWFFSKFQRREKSKKKQHS